MPIITYNKLVRDEIPQIIEQTGKKSTWEKMTDEQYFDALKTKLLEEANEYIESNDIGELADLFEVAYALLDYLGINLGELESIRINKREQRGGFEKRIFLKEVEG